MRAVRRLVSFGAILGLLCLAPGCGDTGERGRGEPRGAVSGAGATTTTMGSRPAPPPPANP